MRLCLHRSCFFHRNPLYRISLRSQRGEREGFYIFSGNTVLVIATYSSVYRTTVPRRLLRLWITSDQDFGLAHVRKIRLVQQRHRDKRSDSLMIQVSLSLSFIYFILFLENLVPPHAHCGRPCRSLRSSEIQALGTFGSCFMFIMFL